MPSPFLPLAMSPDGQQLPVGYPFQSHEFTAAMTALMATVTRERAAANIAAGHPEDHTDEI